MQKIIVLILLIFSFNAFADEPEEVQPREVIILGSLPGYSEAVKQAQEMSKKSGIIYSNRGLVWDEKRGLIFPDNFEDPAFAGSYSGRRSQFDCNKEGNDCISVEKSDFYDGFTKGLYVIVGGVMEPKSQESKDLLARYKISIPDAYVKKTKIFMGCLH